MAEKRGHVSRVPYGEVLLWMLCNVAQQYAMAYEYDTLNPGQLRFQKKWSLLATMPRYLQLTEAFNRAVRDRIATGGRPLA